MKLLSCVVVIASLVASATQAQIITNFDFTGDTAGAKPTGWGTVTPTSPTTPPPTASALGAIVTNVAGNNAGWLYDYSGANNASMQFDLAVPQDKLHLSLSFARNSNMPPTSTTAALYVSLGTNATQGTAANRAADVRLYDDGSYRLDTGLRNSSGVITSAANTGSGQLFESGSNMPPPFAFHTLDIYTFGGTLGQTLNYTGPDSVARVLDDHSFAVYIDNNWVTVGTNTLNGNFYFNSAGFTNDAQVLYRFGLITGASSNTGIDFLVDNIVLSNIAVIPEPSTFVLLGTGAFILTGLRKRSRRSR
jgi:hypothetical protein